MVSDRVLHHCLSRPNLYKRDELHTNSLEFCAIEPYSLHMVRLDENLVELMESDTSHDTETAIQNLIDRAQALKHHTRSEIILALVGSKSHVVTYGSTPGLRALLRKYKVKKVVEKNREKRLLEAQGITDDYLAENAALYFAWAFSTGFLVLLVLWSFLSSATKSMIMPSAAMLGIFAVISLVYYFHMRAANKKD